MADLELEMLADEEMERALTLSWKALASHIPWGDTYEGVTGSGRQVNFERNYVWAERTGGDIQCEIVVFVAQPLYDQGARRKAIIANG